MSPLTTDLARWALELELDDVPEDVIELARTQRRSVLGAIAASADDDAASRVAAAVGDWAGEGPAPMVGTDRYVDVASAIYVASAYSIALDFDDYALFGHSGHSAVLVPIMLACETGSSGSEQLLAQVVANEIALRLGGSCLLGPLNGQLWSFIHAGASALCAARLLALDVEQGAHALAIALTNAPRPTAAGFMAPDTKLLTAAEPTVAGLRAARLALAGVTGPLDVLEHHQGFLDAFSYAPLPSMFGGLGEGWAVRTLSIKPYPGCAYAHTTVEALLEIGPLPADQIEQIDVSAGLLTSGMDSMSAPYAGESPSPVTVSFSIPWNAAIAVLAGRLTRTEMATGWLAEHAGDLDTLRRRVRLHHDWESTARSAAAFGPLLPVRALVRDAGRRRLVTAMASLRGEHEGLGMGWSDLVEVLRVGRRGLGGTGGPSHFWDPAAIEVFEMSFPSHVRVRLRDGSTLEATVDVPAGGAGNEDVSPGEAARTKFDENAPRLWGVDGTRRLASAIDGDDAQLPGIRGR